MAGQENEDIELKNTKGTTTRWRGLKSALSGTPNNNNAIKRPVLQERESDLTAYDDVDISLIQKRTYLLSAGIGDTNKQYNKYKGKIGLVIWCFNIVIHFGLDFYEAWTIFGTSWATCIGLFLVTLVVCCISMIKHSIPWFLKGVKKLKKDGHYPKTLSRVRLLVRFMPFATVAFAIGAAAGQFGCYAADDALRVNFNTNSTIVVPQSVENLLNVLRATSLIHIFYGFASLLLFHLTLVFMIQSSMNEYNDRMGKLFREVPINIQFSEAVNLFSARAKFVRDGSQKSSIVLTTLLVACCTSFVLNAYNFLFLAKHAIYIWFALAPLIWAVTPLMGAAWITKTYWQYKLVVVNAWVDIPDEHELEAEAHAALHRSHSDDKEARGLGKSNWGSVMKGVSDVQKSNGGVDKIARDVKLKNGDQEARLSEDLPRIVKSDGGDKTGTLLRRRSSDSLLNTSTKPAVTKTKRSSSSLKLSSTPTIMFSDYDHESTNNPNNTTQKKFRLAPFTRKVSDSSLSDKIPKQEAPGETHENQAIVDDEAGTVSSSREAGTTEGHSGRSRDVCIDIESPQNKGHSDASQEKVHNGDDKALDKERSDALQQRVCDASHNRENIDSTQEKGCKDPVQGIGYIDSLKEKEQEVVHPQRGLQVYQHGSVSSLSESLSSLSSSSERLCDKGTKLNGTKREGTSHENTTEGHVHIRGGATQSNKGSPVDKLKVPGMANEGESKSKGANLLSGISKTFHQWRTKTKKKKRFNYEKYIIYLESILPTVGFSIGGVLIDWNGIYTFIVVMTFMVGVFAQEAFFGK